MRAAEGHDRLRRCPHPARGDRDLPLTDALGVPRRRAFAHFVDSDGIEGDGHDHDESP